MLLTNFRPANREKMDELDIFKSALRSLIDVHKEHLTKTQNGNQPEVLYKQIFD